MPSVKQSKDDKALLLVRKRIAQDTWHNSLQGLEKDIDAAIHDVLGMDICRIDSPLYSLSPLVYQLSETSHGTSILLWAKNGGSNKPLRTHKDHLYHALSGFSTVEEGRYLRSSPLWDEPKYTKITEGVSFTVS